MWDPEISRTIIRRIWKQMWDFEIYRTAILWDFEISRTKIMWEYKGLTNELRKLMLEKYNGKWMNKWFVGF